MRVMLEDVYRRVVTRQRLPQGIGVVSLAQLAQAFSQMAQDLRSQDAPAAEQEAFQSAIADAAEGARCLTAADRTAVRHTLFTAFDGLPRRHDSLAPVRADFLRQVSFRPATGSIGQLCVK